MTKRSEFEVHAERARQHRDMATAATHPVAKQSHTELADLHEQASYPKLAADLV